MAFVRFDCCVAVAQGLDPGGVHAQRVLRRLPLPLLRHTGTVRFTRFLQTHATAVKTRPICVSSSTELFKLSSINRAVLFVVRGRIDAILFTGPPCFFSVEVIGSPFPESSWFLS